MDLNTKIKDCQLKNYLLNNDCIYWDEKREFYNNCRFYINNTIAIENSPWAKGSTVIYHYRKIGLSVLQKRIIKYLHNHFFQWGSPAYLKMQTLANRLQSTRQAIYRAIGRLVKRRILHRVHIFSDKYKQYRAIILPINPESSLSNKIKNLNTKRFHLNGKQFHPQDDRRNRLVDKLPKSLSNNRCLIDYIYSTNILYSKLTISGALKNSKTSFYTQREKSRCAYNTSFISNERNKDTMPIPRYKLSVTLPDQKLTPDKKMLDFNQLISSVDFDIFNLPDDKRKNLLDYISSHTYDFEFDKLFTQKRLFNKHPIEQKRYRQILSDYIKLFFSNEPLNHDATIYIVNYWNNVESNKFQKHKINNPESPTYIRLLILINYVLHFYYGNDITKFLKMIHRLEMYGSQNHYLANTLAKWKLDHIILLRNNNGTKKYFIDDKKEFEAELFKYRSREKAAAQRLKNIYIYTFYQDDKEKGMERYLAYRNKLESWLDLIINRLRESRRELYGRNLTKRTMVSGYETDSILADYFDWLSFSIAKRPSIVDVCNYDHFLQFVYQEMRGVRGMENFWRPIRT